MSFIYYTHLLKLVTLGNVCTAEGDSGRMLAHAMMVLPFFSTRDLWTTAIREKHELHLIFPHYYIYQKSVGCTALKLELLVHLKVLFESLIVTTAKYTHTNTHTSVSVYLCCLQRAGWCCQWRLVSLSGWLCLVLLTPPPLHNSKDFLVNSWSSENRKKEVNYRICSPTKLQFYPYSCSLQYWFLNVVENFVFTMVSSVKSKSYAEKFIEAWWMRMKDLSICQDIMRPQFWRSCPHDNGTSVWHCH